MKKLLVIDIGNTNAKYGLFEDGQLVNVGRQPTERLNPAEYLEQVDAPIVLSSVVPNAGKIIEAWCISNKRQLKVLTASGQTALKGCALSEMGSDLVAAAFAGLQLYGPDRGVIVIGFGTATTLTAVRCDGSVDGCFITLGLTATVEELSRRCALLNNTAADLKSIDLGRDTSSAINNGILLSQIGGLKAWISQAKQEMGGNPVVVATGGWSELMFQKTNIFDSKDQELTLKGIYLLAEMNKLTAAPSPTTGDKPNP